MIPRYVLPEREQARNINVETKPKQVEAWLARLPLSSPLECAEELADYLATLNASDMPLNARDKVMDRVGSVAEDIVASLCEHCEGAALPLSKQYQRHAELAQRLLLEIANHHKIMLLGRIKRRFYLFGESQIPLFLRRILVTLQAALDVSYTAHTPVPQRLWFDLHQTYQYAQINGLKDAIPGASSEMFTLEHIYKSILLLALADPYHLPATGLAWTKDVIARYCSLVQVFPAGEELDGQHGIFIVDVNSDAPPQPLIRDNRLVSPRWDMLLNTTEIAKHLALLSNQMRTDWENGGAPTQGAMRSPAYFALLQRLKLSWGASLQRQAQRRPHDAGKEIELCFGLKSVHQLMQGSEPQEKGAPQPTLVSCRVENDSIGGMGLHRTWIGNLQIRVGDVVGVRHDVDNWGIGLVRWFRMLDTREVSFGIQWVSPKGLAIQLRRPEEDWQWPGFLLHPAPLPNQTSLLLAPSGALAPDQAAEILTPRGSQPIRIDKRIDATPNVELFRFHMSARMSADEQEDSSNE